VCVVCVGGGYLQTTKTPKHLANAHIFSYNEYHAFAKFITAIDSQG